MYRIVDRVIKLRNIKEDIDAPVKVRTEARIEMDRILSGNSIYKRTKGKTK